MIASGSDLTGSISAMPSKKACGSAPLTTPSVPCSAAGNIASHMVAAMTAIVPPNKGARNRRNNLPVDQPERQPDGGTEQSQSPAR